MSNILYRIWDALRANGRFAIGRSQSELMGGCAYGVTGMLSLSLSIKIYLYFYIDSNRYMW